MTLERVNEIWALREHHRLMGIPRAFQKLAGGKTYRGGVTREEEQEITDKLRTMNSWKCPLDAFCEIREALTLG